MSQCVNHNSIFLDTHKRFCLDVYNSKMFRIALASFQPQTSIFQKQHMLGFTAYEFSEPQTVNREPQAPSCQLQVVTPSTSTSTNSYIHIYIYTSVDLSIKWTDGRWNQLPQWIRFKRRLVRARAQVM